MAEKHMKNENHNSEIEKILSETLNPVMPENEFIPNLQDRLKKKAEVMIENPDYLLLVLLIISGFFIGIVIIWLLKVVYNIVGKDD